ncbi:bifunctional metallophosphatase/5'-nucleotidase [Piscinibacter sakaiensis]|uniref:bifunctional metallophosphatase/5'-nucleotidase n=1 Tax=Piscinibacter sakaiensis TaxID=1547922 RepID=UPI003AAED61D
MLIGRVRLAITLLAAAWLAGCTLPAPTAAPVRLRILAINDFHGHLKPPPDGLRTRDAADPAKTITVPAGGAEHLATQLERLRAGQRHHVFVAAGDLIGASPLLSALFHDEPTIEALNLMRLDASAVGNHEFDKGADELLRQQRGGCHPIDGCRGPKPFTGAEFQYLAASTIVKSTGKPLLPPYVVKRFDGIAVAFIGLTLEGTPRIVVPDGVAGLSFRDEAKTVNALVPELRAQGIEAIVVLIHEGGLPTGGHNECPGISGPIVDIVNRLDKAVDLVISGHTHRAYNCRIDGRLVTSGDSYGRIVTAIDVTLDPATRDITSAVADNTIVHTDLPKDPRLSALIEAYERLAAPLAQRVVGRIAAPLSRDIDAAGASTLGQLIADAQLAATRDAGAQIALMNPGGIRAPLPIPADGLVRYQDLFLVQPFSNPLVTMTLSGEQLLKLLESQWTTRRSRVLQVSRGLVYAWDAARPPGQRIVRDSVRIAGAPLDPAAAYRVTVNGYLAAGGDGFQVLKQGSDRRTGMMDVDALERHLRENPGLAPPSLDRIRRLN